MDDEEFQIEHGHGDYSAAELLEQAQANAQALVIATAAFLHNRGIPSEDWTTALGERFGRAWDAPRPWDAGEFLDAMLTNFRALGAEVLSADLGVDQAEATTSGFPNPELCLLFGVDLTLAARFNDGPSAIAHPRGLRWSWRLDGAVTHYAVIRLDSEASGVRRQAIE